MQHESSGKPCVALLENSAQQYAWGDTEGILPFIRANKGPGFPIGEVWMGSHERAPSSLLIGGSALPLDTLIKEDPRHWLGDKVAERFGDMPYLFKVLAASTPLSLQVHPNLVQAREGFAREELSGLPRSAPERTFKDPRHKPELAVALTPFTAMAGFRPPQEIAWLFGPKLTGVLSFRGEGPEEFREFIRRLFSMRPEEYASLESALAGRARELSATESERARDAGALVLELQELYPHDPGQFGPLLFDILKLSPGQGLYVPAGVIHAYVRGSILEIMACSDNVIRAGLTIKYVDVDLLCDILDPRAVPGLIAPELERFRWGERAVYRTPAEEFRLERISISTSMVDARIDLTTDGPEILLCTDGRFVLHAEAPVGEFEAHQSCFISGACAKISLGGHGTLWRAALGGDLA